MGLSRRSFLKTCAKVGLLLAGVGTVGCIDKKKEPEEDEETRKLKELRNYYTDVFGLDMEDREQYTFILNLLPIEKGVVASHPEYGVKSEETKANIKYLAKKVGKEDAYHLFKSKAITSEELNANFIDSSFEEHDGTWLVGDANFRNVWKDVLDYVKKEAPRSYEYGKNYVDVIKYKSLTDSKGRTLSENTGEKIIYDDRTPKAGKCEDRCLKRKASNDYIHPAAHEAQVPIERQYLGITDKVHPEIHAFDKMTDFFIESEGEIEIEELGIHNRFDYILYYANSPQYHLDISREELVELLNSEDYKKYKAAGENF